MKHRIKDEIQGVLIFVAIIWLIFLIDWVLLADLRAWGIVPRSVSGLTGLITMPFLHQDWQHLIGNTIPLVILLSLLAGSRVNTVGIVIALSVAGGLLLWLFGPNETNHIGVSGLIYGLITFMIVAGITERRPLTLVVALIVGLMYGTTLIGGILPFAVNQGVSWQAHLFGALAGAILGRLMVKSPEKWAA